MTKPVFLIGVVLCCAPPGVAFTQGLAYESLLADYPQPSVDIETVVQQITSEVGVDGQTGQTVMTPTFDYPNRRLIQEAEVLENKDAYALRGRQPVRAAFVRHREVKCVGARVRSAVSARNGSGGVRNAIKRIDGAAQEGPLSRATSITANSAP